LGQFLSKGIIIIVFNKSITFFLIFIIGFFYISTIRAGHVWDGDACLYISHAQNIADGRSYADTGYIYNPFYPILSPHTYPPVFPLLLAPVYKIWGLDFQIMKVYMVFIFLSSLVIINLALKDELSPINAALIVLLIGFNPVFWKLKDAIFSEIPFIFFLYLAIYFIKYLYEPAKNNKISIWNIILLSTAIYLAYGTRSIGIVIIPSLICYDLLKYKKVSRNLFFILLLSSCFIFLQSMLIHPENDYFNIFLSKSLSLIDHLYHNYQGLESFFKNMAHPLFTKVFFFIVIGFFLIGYVKKIFVGFAVKEFIIIFYFIVIILYPHQNQNRFLVPIIPLFIFYFIVGANDSFRNNSFIKAALPIGLCFVILLSYANAYRYLNFGPIPDGFTNKESVELFDYITENTDKNDIFIFCKPRVLALFTNRKASAYHYRLNSQEYTVLWEYIHKIKANYLIKFSKFDEKYFHDFVINSDSLMKLIFVNNDFKLFKIVN
jgi:hypothetical protein